nr:uncharacterized protein LOC109425623 [Aedes albopictus]
MMFQSACCCCCRNQFNQSASLFLFLFGAVGGMDGEYESEEYLEEEENADKEGQEGDQTGDPLVASQMDDNNSSADKHAEDTDMPSGIRYDPDLSDSDDEGRQSTFSFNGVFVQRLYKSLLRPKELSQGCVHGNSLDEVLQCMWKHASKLVRREVQFQDDVPCWSEKQVPDFADVEKFVLLQDTVKKKVYQTSAIGKRLLTSWRNKSIKVLVHVYSTNVGSLGQYQQVMRKLIAPQNPDRSGAHSTRDDSGLANELRTNHPHIEGHFSSWLLWANLINSSPAHNRDQMAHADSPPLELSKYFRWTGVSEAARLQSVHRGMVAAQTNNDAWCRDMDELSKDLNTALNILHGIQRKMENLSARGSNSSELFAAMESATRPEESNFSLQIAERVTDCEDVDHAE